MSTVSESYQIPDGRMFDNQRDAEIALGALGRCEWIDFTALGSDTFRFVLKRIVPLAPNAEAFPVKDGTYKVTFRGNQIVEMVPLDETR